MSLYDELSNLLEHYISCPDWGERPDGVIGPCRKSDCPACNTDGILRRVWEMERRASSGWPSPEELAALTTDLEQAPSQDETAKAE